MAREKSPRRGSTTTITPQSRMTVVVHDRDVESLVGDLERRVFDPAFFVVSFITTRDLGIFY